MMFGQFDDRWRVVMGVVSLGMVAALAGCSSQSTSPSYSDQVRTNASFDDLTKPAISVTGSGGAPVRNNAQGVQPGGPITVTSTSGQLTDVRIPKESGGNLKGQYNDARTIWTSSEPLGFGKTYALSADAQGISGVNSTKVSFATRSPSALTDSYVLPESNSTVGIGQPVAIRFDEPISDRQAAQDAIKVTANPPVDGAFYWLSSNELRWRPEHYWNPGTKVHVDINTYGKDLGGGTFGEENKKLDFTVGRSLIATGDDKTKTVVVRENGKVVRTMPVSFGKDSSPTNPGTYIVGDRVSSLVMDSSTYGVPVNSPGGYKEVVYNDTQLSWSGIYAHAAPWSLYAQGNTNVSNGCLNLSPADAEWFMNTTKRGDIVEIKNTVGEVLPGGDGLGDWNIPWSVWKKGNANKA